MLGYLIQNPACPLEAVHACENLPNHHFVFSASLQTPTWGRIFSPTKFVRILGSLEFMTLAECRGGGEEERERGPDGCNALFDRFSWKWNLFPFGQFGAKNHRKITPSKLFDWFSLDDKSFSLGQKLQHYRCNTHKLFEYFSFDQNKVFLWSKPPQSRSKHYSCTALNFRQFFFLTVSPTILLGQNLKIMIDFIMSSVCFICIWSCLDLHLQTCPQYWDSQFERPQFERPLRDLLFFFNCFPKNALG